MTQRDYFISYTSADEAIAKALGAALISANKTVHFAPWDLGERSIPDFMETGIDDCARMLCVCSPTYFSDAKIYSRAERLAMMHADPDGALKMVVPVIVAPCLDLMPRLLKVYPYVDVSGLSETE
ncbi:MAG: toll/interleukin-1 receptor domain-containing protein, partial [Pseudomonadota bacterium]